MRGANARFGHLITAMATPLHADGSVDYAGAATLAEWLLANGSDSLVINGTTGESPTTTADEKIALLEAVIAAVGADKVIGGAGGNDTAEVIHLAKRSAATGCAGLLSVAPYYNKPSQEGLYRHFSAIAEAVDIPILLYNVPPRTVANIDAATTARLAADIPHIVGTKEASGNLAQVGEIIRTTPDDFDVYSGDDAINLPLLALGGAGAISVISHVVGPDLAAMHRAWFVGEQEKAARLFVKTLPVVSALFSVPSPAPTKWALAALGQPAGPLRLPMVACNDAEGARIACVLKEYGLSL